MSAPTPTLNNRKARHNYHVEESYEVGIMLQGTEVKSVRQAKVNFADSYVDITPAMELYWVNAHIDEYLQGNQFNHNSTRKRKLLAHSSEIMKMHKARELKGYTLIPLKMYFRNGKVKLEIGVCRGKDKYDKREAIKQKESKRSLDRAMKAAMR